MISLIYLVVHLSILTVQISSDRRLTLLSPVILFQIYFIMQLPLNHFLGVNFNLPRFAAISNHFPASDSLYLGGLILASHLFFLASYYTIASGERKSAGSALRWNRKYVNYLAFGIIAVGYVAFLGFINFYGGFSAFAIMREVWRTTGISGSGWIIFPATTAMSLAGCALIINNKDRFRGLGGVLQLMALYVLVAAPATQLGFRSFVLLPALQFIFLYNIFVAKIRIKWLVVSATVMLSIFTLYGMNREVPYEEANLNPVAYLADINEKRPELTLSIFLRSMGADITQQTIDRMSSVVEYKKFYPIFLEALTIYVPSAFWPDKPKALSVQFSNDILDLSGGVSPTVVGEGYWHLGAIGAVILSVFVGLLNGIFEKLKTRSETNDNSALMMISMYPQIIMMAEAFQGYFNGLILVIVFNLLFRWLVSFGNLGRARGI